jgi:hypothetical protein
MRKHNGIEMVEADEIGGFQDPKGKLVSAACKRFLTSRGLETHGFNSYRYGKRLTSRRKRSKHCVDVEVGTKVS